MTTLYEKMQVEQRYAKQCRRRYLLDKMIEMQHLRDECIASDDEIDHITAVDMIVGINAIKKQLDALNKVQKEGDITDEMVEQAREVDTATLIDYVRNRAVGWCHDGTSNTSLQRLPDGKAHCYVCNKTWNAIDILMQRDGYKFPEAVRELCGL